MIEEIKEFQCEGRWSFKAFPDKTFIGVFKFLPNERYVLKILGSDEEIKSLHRLPQDIEVINGETNMGNVALFNCHKWMSGGSSLQGYSFSTRDVFVGGEVIESKEAKFNTFAIGVSNVSEFFDVSSIGHRFPFFEEQWNYKNPEDFSVNVTDKMNIRLSHTVSPETVNKHENKFILTEKPYFIFTSTEGKTVEEYFLCLNHLRRFVSLFTMRPIYLQSFTGWNDDVVRNVKIYLQRYRLYRTSEIEEPENEILERPLFKYSDIKDDFQQLLKQWFLLNENYGPVFDRFFGIVYNDKNYLEDIYMTLFNALEAFQYLKYPDEEESLPEAEHEKRKGEVLRSVPEEYRDWVQFKLGNNRINSETRIRNAFKRFASYFTNIEAPFLYDGAFIKSMVDTRNYLTHSNPAKKKLAASGVEMMDFYSKIRIVLHFALLTELGLESKRVKEAFMGESYYRYGLLKEMGEK